MMMITANNFDDYSCVINSAAFNHTN